MTGDLRTTVAVYVAGDVCEDSKSIVNPDGITCRWQSSDEMMLWAYGASGAQKLTPVKFRMYGFLKGRACFTATLSGPMQEDTYLYNVCYPVPSEMDDAKATVLLSDKQDGRAGNGADVMMAFDNEGGPLKKYSQTGVEGSVCLEMEHMTHFLEFYLPAGGMDMHGENITSIEVTASRNVTGTLTRPLKGIAADVTCNATGNTVTLDLPEPLKMSPDQPTDYAIASILPTSFGADDALNVKVYSDSYIGTTKVVPLVGRNMLAGHATPVRLEIEKVEPKPRLIFTLKGNNIGEDVQKITLTAPSDCIWESTGTNVLTFEPGGSIAVGTQFVSMFKKESEYRKFSEKDIVVSYDSEHVLANETVKVPSSVSTDPAVSLNLTAPYLLFENFDTVPDFSNHDEHATSSTGDSHSYVFTSPAGWTGGRVGGREKQMIRIAGHRESGMWIDAHYWARVDSAPLALIKKTVNLLVSFDYGINSGGLKAYGQTIYVGYVTSAKTYPSGDETGTFVFSQSFDDNDKDSDWTAPRKAGVTIKDVPAGTENRISWRNNPHESSDFASNTTAWLYIDNVIVKVAPQQ